MGTDRADACAGLAVQQFIANTVDAAILVSNYFDYGAFKHCRLAEEARQQAEAAKLQRQREEEARHLAELAARAAERAALRQQMQTFVVRLSAWVKLEAAPKVTVQKHKGPPCRSSCCKSRVLLRSYMRASESGSANGASA